MAQSHMTPAPRGPLTSVLDLFSSVWLGVTLLVLLFVYSALGSSGYPTRPWIWEGHVWERIREYSWAEMTEYEWFNWWPFLVLIGLICLNLTVVTLRRIPLNIINAGVWMVHTGLIILAIGCVIYFGLKVEGDVAVARGRLVLTPPEGPAVSMLAMPGNVVQSEDGRWTFRVSSINPQWALRSGDDEGTETYAVTVSVEGPEQPFMRQVIAGYPQFTEDIVPSGDPHQPMGRAVKLLGRPLVDETLSIELVPDRRDTFYLQAKPSLYLREVGSEPGPWIERPVHGLPRYNDYISHASHTWPASSQDPTFDGLDIHVPSVSPDDPLSGTDIIITDYLRYAIMRHRPVPCAGGEPSPWARVTIAAGVGQTRTYELYADSAEASTAPPENLGIAWVDADMDLDDATSRKLHIVVADEGIDVVERFDETLDENPDLEMTPIEGTVFSWRVRSMAGDLDLGGREAILLEISDGDRTWMRWTFDDPSVNGDLTSDATPEITIPDARIETTYLAPTIGSSAVQVLVGPGEDQLRLRRAIPGLDVTIDDLEVGTPVELAPGVDLVVEDSAPCVQAELRPDLVPRYQRNLDRADSISLVRADIDGASAWLPKHQYPFESRTDVIAGFGFEPTQVILPDGRMIEIIRSRRSAPLPAQVSLDGFRIASHVGGFTGRVDSVLDWHSQVRFEGDDGDVETAEVSVNDPKPREGLWFFQSQWDPPDPNGDRTGVPSLGRNFTVLGVGNRNGVVTMLMGCILSVIGMIYAFYVKPMIKRRRMLAVRDDLAGGDA